MNSMIVSILFALSVASPLAQAADSLKCSSGQKLSQSVASSYVQNAGISVYSSGGCTDASNSRCTSLSNVNCKTIAGILAYKAASKCAITITGGTEVGHSTSGTFTHGNGYKLDISLSDCNNKYIQTQFTYSGIRGDGAHLYKSSSGNVYAREGNHWDILFV